VGILKNFGLEWKIGKRLRLLFFSVSGRKMDAKSEE
jgi:hypothetical protein